MTQINFQCSQKRLNALRNRKNAKLNFKTATEIALKMFRGERPLDICKKYGCSKSTPGEIFSGRAWRDARAKAAAIFYKNEDHYPERNFKTKNFRANRRKLVSAIFSVDGVDLLSSQAKVLLCARRPSVDVDGSKAEELPQAYGNILLNVIDPEMLDAFEVGVKYRVTISLTPQVSSEKLVGFRA